MTQLEDSPLAATLVENGPNRNRRYGTRSELLDPLTTLAGQKVAASPAGRSQQRGSPSSRASLPRHSESVAYSSNSPIATTVGSSHSHTIHGLYKKAKNAQV